jgi:hypothetical protein
MIYIGKFCEGRWKSYLTRSLANNPRMLALEATVKEFHCHKGLGTSFLILKHKQWKEEIR